MKIFYYLRIFYLYVEALVYDSRAEDPSLPRPKFFDHLNGLDYLLNNFDKEGITILEVGSKEVTGPSIIKSKLTKAKYIGIDISSGRNVDIVCDAHELSKFVENGSIDVVYSQSVFEHLYAPWLVAEEISKILKINGYVFIDTHWNFKSHERPWNFFNFSDLGLKALFNNALGFQCIDSGLDLPIRGRFSIRGPKYLRMKEVYGLMSHSYYAGKKISDMKKEPSEQCFNWRNANPSIECKDNVYPSIEDNILGK